MDGPRPPSWLSQIKYRPRVPARRDRHAPTRLANATPRTGFIIKDVLRKEPGYSIIHPCGIDMERENSDIFNCIEPPQSLFCVSRSRVQQQLPEDCRRDSVASGGVTEAPTDILLGDGSVGNGGDKEASRYVVPPHVRGL